MATGLPFPAPFVPGLPLSPAVAPWTEETREQESQAETKFGSIEGAAEYLGLLLESVNEARGDLEAEKQLAVEAVAERRLQAIQLATYKLAQLRTHLTTSHRLLNDLRTIRRLLFAERQAGPLAARWGEGARRGRDEAASPGQIGSGTERKRPAAQREPHAHADALSQRPPAIRRGWTRRSPGGHAGSRCPAEVAGR